MAQLTDGLEEGEKRERKLSDPRSKEPAKIQGGKYSAKDAV